MGINAAQGTILADSSPRATTTSLLRDLTYTGQTTLGKRPMRRPSLPQRQQGRTTYDAEIFLICDRCHIG